MDDRPIANVRLGDDFGEAFARIPLVAAPSIRFGDALEIDWNDMVSAEGCSFVLGNPPFIGAKMQSSNQRAQVRALAGLGGSGGTLDYVAAWFIKAGAYAQGVSDNPPRVAFVATNSITQGEQVAQLWPILFHRHRLEITFAHRTFAWPGRAAVHCVIVGLARIGDEPAVKRLFAYVSAKGEPIESHHDALTAYLFDARAADRHLVVKEASRPINGAPRVVIGSKPIDGGYLIFDGNERAKLIAAEPQAERFLRPYIGSQEYINAGMRWILALQEVGPGEWRNLTLVSERVNSVGAYRRGEIPAFGKTERKAEPGLSSTALAGTPTAFHVTVIPDQPFLVLPKVSSERRDYVPIGWLMPPTIPSDLVFVLLGATLWHLGVLTSAMHMSWLRGVGGRLESRYRYSIGLVYNTFAWPNATPSQQRTIEKLTQAVLDARALPKNTTSSLADLYDPNTMPPELRKAHRDLDLAIDKLYRVRPFGSDRDRVEHLFPLYEALVQPTSLAAKANTRTVRRIAKKRL